MWLQYRAATPTLRKLKCFYSNGHGSPVLQPCPTSIWPQAAKSSGFPMRHYMLSSTHGPEATITLVPVWKLIYDTEDKCNFVINEFNSTFEVQNMGNEAFQNASFWNALFPNEALGYSCLWAKSDISQGFIHYCPSWEEGSQLQPKHRGIFH